MNKIKKALIIGGSNGIGLAISKVLIEQGYYVYILDRQELGKEIFPKHLYSYQYCNLLDLDDDQIYSFAKGKKHLYH